jgi:predicted PurR-regulated permease PerM
MPDRTAARNGLLATIAVLLVAVGLRESYSVSMPLAVAALLIAAIWPVKTALDRFVAPIVSYAATTCILLLILAGFVSAVYFSAAQVVAAFAQNWSRLENSYRSAASWADKWGINLGGQQGYDRVIGFAQDLLANAYTTIGYLGFIAILVVLGLPEIESLKSKIGEEFSRESRLRIIGVIEEIASKVRLYLGMTTLTSLLTGAASGLWAFLFGLDLALVWAILNFLLNYIPVVGNLIGIIPPSVYALMQFQSWTVPLIIFAGLAIIQLLISNFVYPMLQGRSLSLSPVAIILTLAFWTLIWGIAGALIAVPLTVTLITICEQFESTRWVAKLVSGPGRNNPEQPERRHDAKAAN